MTAPLPFDRSDAPSPFASEPAARAVLRPLEVAGPWATARCEQVELISRGDIVNGLRARGPGPEASPRRGARSLLLLAHDAGGSTQAREWSAVAPWIARGIDAVAIDLPLHGRRSSAKLTERLIAAVAALARGERLDTNGGLLVEEFRRQAVCDLTRTREALLATGDYDPARTALLAVGLGAWVADAWLESADRLAAAVLVASDRAPAPGARKAPSTTVVLPTAHDLGWAADAERALASSLHF